MLHFWIFDDNRLFLTLLVPSPHTMRNEDGQLWNDISTVYNHGQMGSKHTLNQTKVTLWVSPDTVQVNVTSVPDLACISGSAISELDDFGILTRKYSSPLERHKTLNASPILNKKSTTNRKRSV